MRITTHARSMIGFLHALRHNMGCSSMRTRMARMARDGLDRGEGCEQGSLEDEELAVNRERENHAAVKAGCHCHCCFRAQPGRLLFLFFHTKFRGPLRSCASSLAVAERASQVVVTSSREKQSVHYVPAKITCSLLKPAHALASQHLRTLDA